MLIAMIIIAGRNYMIKKGWITKNVIAKNNYGLMDIAPAY